MPLPCTFALCIAPNFTVCTDVVKTSIEWFCYFQISDYLTVFAYY